jgi:hypothetical protein
MQSFALPLGCYTNPYNRQHCYSANGYLAPLVYEQALKTSRVIWPLPRRHHPAYGCCQSADLPTFSLNWQQTLSRLGERA